MFVACLCGDDHVVVQGPQAGLRRAKTATPKLERTKTQLEKSGIKGVSMTDLSQQGEHELALKACIEEVLGFLKDTKVGYHYLMIDG